MKKGKYLKPSPRRFSTELIVSIAVMLLILLLCIVIRSCTKEQLLGFTDNIAETVEKNPNSIAIPGYEALTLKANSKKQEICFPNPSQNTCYFQISLFLEDGTLLWESGLIKPGEKSKPIVLENKLEQGTYSNAILRYSCYRMDEARTPLNGAETKLTLWVI